MSKGCLVLFNSLPGAPAQAAQQTRDTKVMPFRDKLNSGDSGHEFAWPQQVCSAETGSPVAASELVESDGKRHLVEGVPAAASELVELDGKRHLDVGHKAHADEDAKHDERVGADAETVLDVWRDERGRVGHVHALRRADGEALKLVLDQAAIAVRHIGQLLDPGQVHRRVRLRSHSMQPRQAKVHESRH